MFEDCRYQKEKLDTVWSEIQDILTEKDRVQRKDLATLVADRTETYPEQTLHHGVLQDMQKELVEEDIVKVDKEVSGNQVGHFWSLKNTEKIAG